MKSVLALKAGLQVVQPHQRLFAGHTAHPRPMRCIE